MINRIDEEAEKEARSILGEAAEESRSVLRESEMEISKQVSDLKRKLDKELETTRNIYISEGKRKARQALLSSKEDLIWESISEVRKHLASMRGTELSIYLISMYEKASEALGKDMIVYPVRDVDAEVLSGKNGIKGILDNSTDLPVNIGRLRGKDMLGGFIATTSDGSRVVNMSFQGLIEKEEEMIREIIARELFGE
jgi:vacuolar-type H+-ATPase subunit E/Vma4